tara:strand:+ start:28896 stop:29387 length:492 start_codon:yes stop_codon:yes gene_type:complete
MPTPEQIRKAMEDMAKGHGPAVSNIAKVKSVDENKATCLLIDEDGQEIFDVRLRPVLTGKKSFILVPKVGSYVLAVRVEDDDDWMVIACDEIEKVGYYVGDTIVELTDKVQISAGGENLATLIDGLFEAIGKMVFTTNTGPTIKLVNKPEFEDLRTKFKTLLK